MTVIYSNIWIHPTFTLLTFEICIIKRDFKKATPMVLVLLFINALQNWFFRKIIYQFLKLGDICIPENHWLYHNCVTYLIHLFLENYKLCNFMGAFSKIAFLILALYRFLLFRVKSTAERKSSSPIFHYHFQV